MRVKIRRQDHPGSAPYWQEFDYKGPADNTVAGLLDDLNYRDDIQDICGRPVRRISWECSCQQGVCGSCAMVINGRPALACETFLRDLKGGTLRIEPLRKFPTICDLVVDRGIMEENLRDGRVYIEHAGKSGAAHDHQYANARCLKCGLCHEVCPNYSGGKNFYGAAFANDCYLCASVSEGDADRIGASYRKHFADGCSKSLSCRKVCPVEIPTVSSMAKLNRRRRETP